MVFVDPVAGGEEAQAKGYPEDDPETRDLECVRRNDQLSELSEIQRESARLGNINMKGRQYF